MVSPSLRGLLIHQADSKTFTALNCCGTSVIMALTAQNTTGICSAYAYPSGFVRDQVSPQSNAVHLTPFHQLKLIIDDNDVLAMKMGMSYYEATIWILVRHTVQ